MARFCLQRFEKNPILTPISAHEWESLAVFNPGAVYLEGRVHILYRAIGVTDTSVLGYASSSDGFHVEERLDKPVYVPREPFEGVQIPHSGFFSEETGKYVSGGGTLGGCEDPRVTFIDDRVYLTYVAFDGYNPPRVAMSSISREDFLSRRWKWKKPVLISPPGVIDKSACILPEKIGGKYVIFHRIYPNLLIDYVDDLEFDGNRFLAGEYFIPPDASSWDSRKLGAGPPPFKTKDGWLLIYHAVDDADPWNYKMGAMLIDLEREPRVIARSKQPILEPEAIYEREGLKSGVIYPCGGAIIGNELMVYYGAADQVVCVAHANVNKLLDYLIKDCSVVSIRHREASVEKLEEELSGYCSECQAMRKMLETEKILLKNGYHGLRGRCEICGKTIFHLQDIYGA